MIITVHTYDDGKRTFFNTTAYAPLTDKLFVVQQELDGVIHETIYQQGDISLVEIEHEPEPEDSGLILPKLVLPNAS